MNKIVLDDLVDQIKEENYELKKEKNQLIMRVFHDMECELELSPSFPLWIELESNITLKIKHFSNQIKGETNYHYVLKQNSSLQMNEFLTCKDVKENIVVDLIGEYACCDISIRSIATAEEHYTIQVNHQAAHTKSNVEARAVNFEEGNLHFHIEGIVPKDVIDCNVNQDTRIYTFNEKKCTIDPILLIENNDVIANHAAFIGRFEEETLFYLMSRGIPRELCNQLLIKGFLNKENDDEISDIIHKYWG